MPFRNHMHSVHIRTHARNEPRVTVWAFVGSGFSVQNSGNNYSGNHNNTCNSHQDDSCGNRHFQQTCHQYESGSRKHTGHCDDHGQYDFLFAFLFFLYKIHQVFLHFLMIIFLRQLFSRQQFISLI